MCLCAFQVAAVAAARAVGAGCKLCVCTIASRPAFPDSAAHAEKLWAFRPDVTEPGCKRRAEQREAEQCRADGMIGSVKYSSVQPAYGIMFHVYRLSTVACLHTGAPAKLCTVRAHGVSVLALTAARVRWGGCALRRAGQSVARANTLPAAATAKIDLKRFAAAQLTREGKQWVVRCREAKMHSSRVRAALLWVCAAPPAQ